MSLNSIESINSFEQPRSFVELFKNHSRSLLEVIASGRNSSESIQKEDVDEWYSQESVNLEIQFCPSQPSERLRVRGKGFMFGRKRVSPSEGLTTFFYYSAGQKETLRITTANNKVTAVDLMIPTARKEEGIS